MSYETVIFWVLVPPGLILFIALCLLIHSYLKRKLPALQTLLDFIIIDTVHFAIWTEVFTLLPFLLHFSSLKLNSFCAHLCMLLFRFFFTSLYNWTQTALIVKAILLFKSQWFDGLSDEEHLKKIRIWLILVTLTMFVIDLIPFVPVENRLKTGLVLATGDQNVERAPIGGMVCALPVGIVILLVSFFALRIAMGKYLSDEIDILQDKTKTGLNYGIIAIICFLIIWILFAFRFKVFTDTIGVPIFHLCIFNSITIYFIESRPSLKAFVISKLFIDKFPFQNTVHVQSSINA